MSLPSEIRYAKIQEQLEPSVTELNKKKESLKIDWVIPIEFCHTEGTIAHGGTVSFILDASMFFVVDLLNEGKIGGLSLALNIQFFNPCPPGKVQAKAKVLKSGKNFAFTQSDLIYNGQTMASGTQQMKLFPKDPASDNSWFTPKKFSIIS